MLKQGIGVVALIVLLGSGEWALAEVFFQPTPDNGLQPRLVQAQDGSVHLLYFKKRLDRPAAREGSLFYRQYLPEQGRFGNAVRVSSQAFNLQTVSISRASMAIDGAGRVHVMWYLPREAQYLYTRSNPERTRFEPQRSIVQDNLEGIDAGGDVAAWGQEVAIVWGAGDLSQEHERSMFGRFSHDGGATFGDEIMLANPDFGACACCSMAVDYASASDLIVAYRSAIDGIGRHMQIMTVSNVDQSPSSVSYAEVQPLQQWEATFCPLSTNDIAFNAGDQPWLVFETESRIIKMNLDDPASIAAVADPFTETRQKNPAIAFNGRGEYVIAWAEAISHSRGGRLNLRWYDKEGAEMALHWQEAIELADFTFPAVAAMPDGNFLVLY
ncbi:MAG: hypothetical protein MI746_01990 [Pseudomonadales bacterium]|nr:hypothetical protein [Pseudomonadales bacterium]